MVNIPMEVLAVKKKNAYSSVITSIPSFESTNFCNCPSWAKKSYNINKDFFYLDKNTIEKIRNLQPIG